MCSEVKLYLASSTLVALNLLKVMNYFTAICHIWCIHRNHMMLLMFQSAKSQKISGNTNVHNSDVLNTVFKSECRSSSLSLFPWNLIFEHRKKSQHDWSSTNIANTLFWCCLQHLVVLVFHHTIPSLIPFESTQMEIKINIKYLPLKALKVYNVHVHIGRKPVLKLHQRLNPTLLRPIIN